MKNAMDTGPVPADYLMERNKRIWILFVPVIIEMLILMNLGLVIVASTFLKMSQMEKKRFRQLEKNPETAWRVTKRDHEHLKTWGKFVSIAERVLRETSTGHAPWQIIDGSDLNYTKITVAEHILSRIREHLALRRSIREQPVIPVIKPRPVDEMSVLDALDLGLSLSKKE